MTAVTNDRTAGLVVKECLEPLSDGGIAELEPLLDRVGPARVVLIGEASHGTSEFYRIRAKLTQELVRRSAVSIVAIEGDWPDVAGLDRYVRQFPQPPGTEPAFTRFPTWMWRNRDVADFVEWLRLENATRRPGQRVSLRGLDLYSMYASIQAVLGYLDKNDPPAGREARERYSCLNPWTRDPGTYGRLALSGRCPTCEGPVVDMLVDLMRRRLANPGPNDEPLFDAERNAALVAAAEQYYRAMYLGSVESWNLRDTHMFATLETLLSWHGAGAKAVVWAHNSHVGDARATEMGWGGELNLGQLCRQRLGNGVAIVGFGTDRGSVAAASDWDGPMETMRVRPALPGSYEAICHGTGAAAFALSLAEPRHRDLRLELEPPRLERAIGVIYRPDTERASHYFMASLPHQFDEYIWVDQTTAVSRLPTRQQPGGLPDTYPFGL